MVCQTQSNCCLLTDVFDTTNKKETEGRVVTERFNVILQGIKQEKMTTNRKTPDDRIGC